VLEVRLYAAIACQRDVVVYGQEAYSFAHRSTNLKRWHSATQPYEIQYEWTFEPYIMGLRACELNEAFPLSTCNLWCFMNREHRPAALPARVSVLRQ
jgi:hypothetical protein